MWVERKIYHTLPSLPEIKRKSFRVELADAGQAKSLELRNHSDFLAKRLSQLGLRQVEEGKNSDYLVKVYFEIMSQDKLRIVGGQTTATSGGTSSHQSTAISRGGVSIVSGTTINPSSTFQTTAPTLRTDTEYSRMVSVVILSRDKDGAYQDVPVFEASAFSEGGTRNTPKIFPALLGSLLHDFPGKSGELDSVQMFMDDATINEKAQIGETQFLR